MKNPPGTCHVFERAAPSGKGRRNPEESGEQLSYPGAGFQTVAQCSNTHGASSVQQTSRLQSISLISLYILLC